MSDFENILVYIEPWIENAVPGSKKNYIWWFGEIVNSIVQYKKKHNGKTNVCFLMGDDCALYWSELKNTDSTLAVINQSELHVIHSNPRESLIKWLNNQYSIDEWTRMSSLVKSKLLGFSPELIFTITPVPFLAHLYPNALILYRDAMYCREPWPDEMTCFDPLGLYINGITGRFGKDLLSISTETDAAFCDRLRKFIEIKQPIRSIYLNLIGKHKYFFDKLVLLPLQSNGYYNFYSATTFLNQFEYLCYVLDNTPKNIGVIVTEHPDDATMTKEAISYLRFTYKNFIFFEAIKNHHSPSQYLLHFVDGLISVSSGLCYQAMLLNKPIYVIGHSHFSTFLSSFNDIDKKIIVNYDGATKWLLTHYFFTYSYMKNGEWLCRYIGNMMKARREDELTLDSFSGVDDENLILNDIFLKKRDYRLFKPGLEPQL